MIALKGGHVQFNNASIFVGLANNDNLSVVSYRLVNDGANAIGATVVILR